MRPGSKPEHDGQRQGPVVGTEADWRRVVDDLHEAVVLAGVDDVIVYANHAVERLLGWAPTSLIGQPLTTLMPDRFHERHLAGFSRYVETREPRVVGRPLRVPALRQDGHEVSVELLISTAELDGGPLLIGLLRSVSEGIDIEGPTDLAELILAVLADTSTLEEARPRLLATIGETLDWHVAQMWEPNGDGALHRRGAWHLDPDVTAPFEEASRRSFAAHEGLPGRVWQAAAPVWAPDLASELNFPRADAAQACGLHGGFAFPLIAGGAVVAVIEVFTHARRPPSVDVQTALTELGRELGAFLTRRAAEEERLARLDFERQARADAERAHRQVTELARTLQQSLLPPAMPEVDGLELAGCYHPAATGFDVGGDFYDVFPISPDVWGFAIGDVCGKGPEAASLTALIRYTLRAAAMQTASPGEALASLNDAMRHQLAPNGRNSRFATVAHGRISVDHDRPRVTIATGGHPLPMLVPRSGEIAALGESGTLLGVFARVKTSDVTITLEDGDAIVLVTDGVLEARRNGVLFDLAGLRSVLEATSGWPASQVARAVEQAALDHQGGAAADDIAVVVIKAVQAVPR